MFPNLSSIMKIVYYYASEDEKLVERLQKHLSPIKNYRFIAEFLAYKVQPKSLHSNISESYKDADFILLLLSPDSFSCEVIDDLMLYPRAVRLFPDQPEPLFDVLGKHNWIRYEIRYSHNNPPVIPTSIPVLLRPVLWGISRLKHLSALPYNHKPVTSWNNRDEAFLDIALGIAKAIKERIKSISQTDFTDNFLAKAEAEKMRSFPGVWLTADERETYRSEAGELYRKTLDIMSNIEMEIKQHADQMDSDQSVQMIGLQQSSPLQIPDPSSVSQDKDKLGTDKEEREELGP